jgi:hypothetical protein
MSHIAPVNLDVLSIGPTGKKGMYEFQVQFHDDVSKTYDYVRQSKEERGTPHQYVVIAGVKVIFNPYTCKVVQLLRKYDTKGNIRTKQSGIKKKEGIKWDRERWERGWESEEEPNHEAITPKAEEIPEESKEEVKEESKAEEQIVEVPRKVRHVEYNNILQCLEEDIPVYLAGPAGAGKNHTLEQIAKEKGWPFFFSNSVQQEYKLTGFIDAGGKYHETEFYKALTCEEECMFFLDEIDASIPEVLVLLNAAIANGYFEFPNGRVNFDHVHFAAAGNTVGSGADDLYTGRMVLDQATLDRFAIIPFDYDRNVELKLSRGNVEFVDFIRKLRDYATNNGIRATFSYRCITMATKLEKAGMSLDTIMRIAILKGLDKDTINSIRLYGTGKYYEALNRIRG